MPNRLAAETSPYLLQHAENPVDWYPWGDEAFARARAEDKPVLVSIGYAACHWCHVMEHESFEDPDVAAVMNDGVRLHQGRPRGAARRRRDLHGRRAGDDRLRRLAAERVPDARRRPVLLRHLLPARPAPRAAVVARAARRRRATRGRRSARRSTRRRSRTSRGCRARRSWRRPRTRSIRVVAGRRPSSRCGALFDGEHGGWGGAPKFPATSVMEFLLARGENAMPLQTLRRMASGGIYDQVGGGFARYSVDARWLVPHFEKMLYDNALLARAYLHAFQVSGEPLFRRVCEETLDWAMRELRQDEGGFASSLDADTEGVEGKFYVWTPAEILAALGDSLGDGRDRALRRDRGRATSRARTSSCGRRPTRPSCATIKDGLLAARAARVRPALDDKRLTSWNALMISALADAGAALERADYLAAAVTCARFVERELRDSDGRLLRTFNRGRAKLPAYLEDHAYLLEAYLTLYEATFDAEWFTRAVELADDDPGALLRPVARRLLLGLRRPHGPDRPPQGPRGRPDPLRRLRRGLRPAAARADDRRGPLRGRGDVADPAAARDRPPAPAGLRPPAARDRLPAGAGARGGAGGRRRVARWRASCAAASGPTRVLAGGDGAVPLLEGRVPVDGGPPPTSASTSPASCR